MAREVTKVELYGANNDGDPRSYIIASSAVVAKGTFLKVGDGRTASASTGTGDIFAGIASMGKVADYSVTIAAWTNGIFNCVASGVITTGDLVQTITAYPNAVSSLTVNTSSHAIVVGVALDDVANGERVNVRILI